MTQIVLAAVLGVLFAAGTFLVLRRDVVRVVWGVAIIGQAANVYLVTMGGLSGRAPILAHGAEGAATAPTDPLVQALVLTAIVIGFGTIAFALVLTYRVYEEHGTVDVDDVAGRERAEGALASMRDPAGAPGATADPAAPADADGGEPDG